jgi:hypothetical protein
MTPKIYPKGDGKGRLKPRNLEGLLDGEKHTFTIRPYVVPIEHGKFKIGPRHDELPRYKREGRR